MNENEKFWKDLMGEDLKFSDSNDIDPKEPENVVSPDEFQNEPLTDKEVDVEYVDKSGGAVRDDYPLPEKKPEPEAIPAEPIKREIPLNDAGSKEENAGERVEKRPIKKKKSDDFEIEFDFDEAYQDVNEKVIRRGRHKRTGCLSGILMFLFIVCISVVLACVGWICATDVLGLGDEDRVVEVTVPSDIFSTVEREKENEAGEKEMKEVSVADIDYIADMLEEQGFIKYKWLFKEFSKLATADEKIKAGTYELNMNYDYRALVTGMTATGGKKVKVNVTIPEGYTITQIVNLLVENKVCEKAELLDTLANYDFDYEFLDKATLGEAKRLEGYLFPDTYTFYMGDTPVRAINKMLKNFSNKWTDEMQSAADELGYSMHDILIVASMIEKEAGGNSERATIASVIYNRLKNHSAGTYGYLQIDATIYYAIEDTGAEFSQEYDSPYNTYVYPGLPKGPISNPGIASIKAALKPENTKYYYYALGKEHLHKFFKDYNSFVNFVNSDEYGG